MSERLCKDCRQPFIQYTTADTRCSKCKAKRYSKPRSPIASGRPPKSAKRRKPIKQVGKVGRRWMETRARWIELNPPDKYGRWKCYLGIAPDCPGWVTIETLNVDHIQSRVRRPDLRFEQSNLNSACPSCNAYKGSKDLDEIIHG